MSAHVLYVARGMVGALLSFGSALLIGQVLALPATAVGNLAVLGVLMAVSLSRVRRRGALLGVAVVTVAAAVAGGIGLLMAGIPVLGDTVFVVVFAAAIWVRRFDPGAVEAGSLVSVVLLATLIAPAPGGVLSVLGSVLVAGVAYGWVAVIGWLGGAGWFRKATFRPSADRNVAFLSQAAPSGLRPVPSTRMALQMATALAVAFAVGALLFGAHATWVVLTAAIVASGTSSRGDVVHKSVLRIGGALLGTVAATGVIAVVAPEGAGVLIFGVLIFVVLAGGVWLRPLGYAWWAGCFTAALALLYAVDGQEASGLLLTRLGGIAVGGVIGVAAAWLVLPIRTTALARRRVADTLAAIGDLLAEPHRSAALRPGVDQALARLERVAPPLRARRRLPGRPPAWAGPADMIDADMIDAVGRCAGPVHDLARLGADGAWAAAAAPLAAARREVAVLRRGLKDPAAATATGYRDLPETLAAVVVAAGDSDAT